MGYQIYKFCQNSVLSLPFVFSTLSIIVKENTENSNYATKDINTVKLTIGKTDILLVLLLSQLTKGIVQQNLIHSPQCSCALVDSHHNTCSTNYVKPIMPRRLLS